MKAKFINEKEGMYYNANFKKDPQDVSSDLPYQGRSDSRVNPDEYSLVRNAFDGLTNIIDGLTDGSIETPEEFKYTKNWKETLTKAHYLIGRLANRDLDKHNDE